mmetsp:Transcript_25257/g.62188  ORF Transcript_25257/g.62188 Transcript_25257/m.62188 type:complete len:496 (-) Transcript_25257:539-2026(-)
MKSDAAEIAAHFEKKPPENNDLATITFTRDHSWLDAMQMLQDFQESDDLMEKGKRIHWCIWPNAPIIEEVSALMIETLEYYASNDAINGGVHWERFVFQDMDQSNENHCQILSTVCRTELFQCLWIGGRNDQDMTRQTAIDLSHAISKNSSIQEICVFLKLTEDCFPVLGKGLENANNQKKLSLHLNLSDSVYGGDSPLPFEFQNGLAVNKSLQQLDLDGLPVQWLPLVFQALRNSSVEELSLKKCRWEEAESTSKNEGGSPVWDQVAAYLSSKECKLKILDLSYPSSNLNVSRLIACLDMNASLQTLRLRHACLVASDFFELLASAKLRVMDEVDLRSNSISLLDFSNLVFDEQIMNRLGLQNNPDPSTNRLSRLNLDGNRNNHIWPKEDAKKIQKVLLWLLNHNPSLIFLGDRFARSYLCCPLVQHTMDLNWVGKSQWRTVSVDSSTFQTALWPHMLARPTTTILSIEPKRQASVVFRLVVDGVGMLALQETG